MLLRTLAVLALVLHTHNAVAQSTLEPLRALKSVCVVVTVNAAAESAGIDTSSIRVQIELELRRVGIIVTDTSSAILGVEFTALEAGTGGYTFSYMMGLYQTVILAQSQTPRPFGAFTWVNYGPATASRPKIIQMVEDVARRMTQAFLNDYLAANPPRR